MFVPVAWDAAGLAGGVAAQQSPVGLSHAVLLMLNMYAAMELKGFLCPTKLSSLSSQAVCSFCQVPKDLMVLAGLMAACPSQQCCRNTAVNNLCHETVLLMLVMCMLLWWTQML